MLVFVFTLVSDNKISK